MLPSYSDPLPARFALHTELQCRTNYMHCHLIRQNDWQKPPIAHEKARLQFESQPGFNAISFMKLDLARPVVTLFWLNCSAEYMS